MTNDGRYKVTSKVIGMLTEYWKLRAKGQPSKGELNLMWDLQTKIMNKLFFDKD